MSLIIDSLKKIRSGSSSGGGKSAVPPSLLNLSPKGGKKVSPALIVLLVISLLGLGVIFFMPTNDSGNYRVSAPATTGSTPAAPAPAPVVSQPAQTPQPQPAPEQPAQEQDLTAVEEPLPMPTTPPQYDPTAANKQRLLSMKSLPEIGKSVAGMIPGMNNKQAESQSPAPQMPQLIQNAIPNMEGMNQNPALGMKQPGGAQPVQQQPTQVQPVIIESPRPMVASALTGRAKAEFDKKIDYNTKFASAATAFQNGNNRKAEEIYEQIMQEKPSKEGLNNLLMAKVRMGKINDLVPTVNEYKNIVDTSILSNVALEMNKLGMSMQALTFLSNYTEMPGNGQIYYAAGIIQESTNNMQRAETAFEKALNISPADPYFLYAAARNKDEQKKYNEALTYYNKIQQIPASDSIKKNAKTRADAINDYLTSLGNKPQ